MSKRQITQILFGQGGRITLFGRTGILQSVLREDGSGNNFLLSILWDNGITTTEFVRTID